MVLKQVAFSLELVGINLPLSKGLTGWALAEGSCRAKDEHERAEVEVALGKQDISTGI